MQKIAFFDFKVLVGNKEGIVLLGAGGDLNDWVNGIADLLGNEQITSTENPDELFTEKYVLTTTGGRTDLALIVDFEKVDTGKMALWRLRFDGCSWISDYLVNYEGQHSVLG